MYADSESVTLLVANSLFKEILGITIGTNWFSAKQDQFFLFADLDIYRNDFKIGSVSPKILTKNRFVQTLISNMSLNKELATKRVTYSESAYNSE